MNDNKLIPKLRFPDFHEEWSRIKFKDICTVNQGLQIAISERFTTNGENRYFYITNEFLKESSDTEYYIENPPKSVICTNSDVLMTRTGNTGKVITDVEGAFHNNFFKINYSSDISRYFLVYILNSEAMQHKILRLAGTSTIPDLKHNDFYNISFNLPSIDEQVKIEKFLLKIDEDLKLLNTKLIQINNFKKSLMQNIFSQKLRFENNNGEKYPDWKTYNLGDLIEEVSEKSVINNQYEVLSSTKEKIVLQSEYFDRDIASNDNTGYKILRKKQMVLSPQNLWMGNININFDFDVGLVSPSYKIYNIDENIVLVNYMNFVIKTPRMLYEYKCASEQGASVVRRNLNKKLFNEIKISIPSIEEQQKISGILLSIDKKINFLEEKIFQMENFKKGLLQQMLMNIILIFLYLYL